MVSSANSSTIGSLDRPDHALIQKPRAGAPITHSLQVGLPIHIDRVEIVRFHRSNLLGHHPQSTVWRITHETMRSYSDIPLVLTNG